MKYIFLLYNFRYNKGVLLPRSAEDQTQVEIDKHTTTDKQTTLIQDVEESFISEHTTTTITSNTYREMKFLNSQKKRRKMADSLSHWLKKELITRHKF